jgi:hypothetical protein
VLTAPRAVISLAAGGAALFVVALVITLVASG